MQCGVSCYKPQILIAFSSFVSWNWTRPDLWPVELTNTTTGPAGSVKRPVWRLWWTWTLRGGKHCPLWHLWFSMGRSLVKIIFWGLWYRITSQAVFHADGNAMYGLGGAGSCFKLLESNVLGAGPCFVCTMDTVMCNSKLYVTVYVDRGACSHEIHICASGLKLFHWLTVVSSHKPNIFAICQQRERRS